MNQIISPLWTCELLVSLFTFSIRSHFLLLHLCSLCISSSVIVVGVPVGTVCLCVSALRQACMVLIPSNV
jgi:hypothetical protein